MHELSSLLVRLNVATRQWHATADAPWQDLLRVDVSRIQYVDHLVRTYGVVAPFESACKYTPGLARVLDFRELTRAGLIAQDLLSLGLTPVQVASVAQCDSITPFHDVPEALGWLYTVERWTLLHDRIRRHLVVRLPDVASACAYLAEHGGRAGEHWTSVGRVLDRVGADAEAASAIVAAARPAFETAIAWYGRSTVARRAV